MTSGGIGRAKNGRAEKPDAADRRLELGHKSPAADHQLYRSRAGMVKLQIGCNTELKSLTSTDYTRLSVRDAQKRYNDWARSNVEQERFAYPAGVVVAWKRQGL
jgi:hypothetical protein